VWGSFLLPHPCAIPQDTEEDEMSDSDLAFEAVERLDYADPPKGERSPGFDRRAFLPVPR